MYSEKTYKNYIFWMQVKRIIVILILSCLGAALGVLIGKILESTVQIKSYNNIIIIVSTIIFFLLGLLLTVGTGKQVQDGYWRIAVLRKLTVIQKNLELNNDLLRGTDRTLQKNLLPATIDSTSKKDFFDDSGLYKFEDDNETKNMQKKKKKKSKILKKPEIA